MDYDNTAAVDFFLSAVRNHRATTVQEMVNLYETEMDQRRMERGSRRCSTSSASATCCK